MEPLVVETSLEIGDWQALQTYLKQRHFRQGKRWKRVLAIGLYAALMVVLLSVARDAFGKNVTPQILTGFFVAFVYFLIIATRQARAFRPAPDSVIFSPTRMQFDAAGFRLRRVGLDAFTEWGVIHAIDETALHVFLVVDRTSAYVIPKRSITSVTPQEFVARLRAFREASVPLAPAPAPIVEAPAPEPAPPNNAEPLPAWITVKATPSVEPQPPFWRSLKTNLISGLRVLGVRNVSLTDFVATFDQVVALLVATCALSAMLDWIRAPEDAVFTEDGLYSWALWLGLGVLLSALIARAHGAATETRKVLIVVLSVAPWAITLLWALLRIPVIARSEDVLSIIIVGIVLVVGIRVARTSQGYMSIGALVIVLVASLVLSRLDHYVYLDTRIWTASTDTSAADSSDESAADWDAAESQLFNEPERIADAVGALAPETPGTSDVYYVGFAGDGSQGVFRREAQFGEKVFATSMGTGPRSLELINDESDRIAFPLGTMSGLHYALSLIGSRMNPSEDVVVLFLTSHGSQEDGISVQNGGFPLTDIEPEQLRRALDASGIQWRIVIVSACYAGIFVDPLKDDHTLVITAADAEHTSFGCADDRDLTYFGEAFLKDALPKATSLEQAFKTARTAIRAREKEEKLTPSNPQMYLGAAMREKLASLGTLPLGAANASAVPANGAPAVAAP
jgi:hypothetical protein